MTITPELIIALLGIVATGGVAWGGVRIGLNGTRKNVADMKLTLEAHVEHDNSLHLQAVQRLARLETKVNIVLGLPDDSPDS